MWLFGKEVLEKAIIANGGQTGNVEAASLTTLNESRPKVQYMYYTLLLKI